MNPSQLLQNGTGFKWAEGSALSFCTGNKTALEWFPCGCAELHLGKQPFVFACEKHENGMREVFQKKSFGTFVFITSQCQCYTIQFSQGVAFTPCKEHHQAIRRIAHETKP